MEYIKQFENDRVNVFRIKIMPQEQTELHYDVYPHIVIALNGGTIMRNEADGSTTHVEFPTGKALFRAAESPDKVHGSVNISSAPIELIIIELK
ncbi:hypothetical protein KG892_00545 [Vermiphilus pyriformis]|nr:MAG: hypothetical protein KG892_00545 [Vermiphilus pyriformis]